MTKSVSGSKQPADEVYGPPHTLQDTVDVVCSIVDEGPQPMRNMRPSQKNRNAADKFTEDHQTVYEERSKNSNGQRIDDVKTHNSGYPQMHDELARRRSIVKVSAIRAATAHRATTKRNKHFRSRKVDPRKRGTISKSDAKKSRNPRRSITKRKSTKRQSRGHRSNGRYRRAAILTDIAKKSGTVDKTLSEDKMAAGNFVARHTYCLDDANSNGSKNGSHISDPDSNASVSTYNSFGSMAQEPMVSE